MRKTLPSGLEVAPLGRCVASSCPELATHVVTFRSERTTVPQPPVGYCAGHIQQRFLDDGAYEEAHRRRHDGLGPYVFRRSWYEIREPNETEQAELDHEQQAEGRWRAQGRIGVYRRIVELHQAQTVDGLLVDGWTAAACVALHDALKEDNRKQWLAMPVALQCEVAVRLTMGGN